MIQTWDEPLKPNLNSPQHRPNLKKLFVNQQVDYFSQNTLLPLLYHRQFHFSVVFHFATLHGSPLYSDSSDRAIFHAMGKWSFWLSLLIIPVAGLVPRFIVKVFSQYYFPSDVQIAREAEKFGTFSDWERGELEMNPLPQNPLQR